MLTTAGLSRSAMSANDTPSGETDPADAPRADTGCGAVADTAGAGVIDPATTKPIRNATVAVSDTVTARNR